MICLRYEKAPAGMLLLRNTIFEVRKTLSSEIYAQSSEIYAQSSEIYAQSSETYAQDSENWARVNTIITIIVLLQRNRHDYCFVTTQ